MGEIKSAWEIALERTQNVKSDKASLEAHEYREAGKRLLARMMDETEELDLDRELKQYDKKKQPLVKEGFFEVLMSNLNLPSDEASLSRIRALKPAFEWALKDRRTVDQMLGNLEEFLSNYLKDKTQLVETLRERFRPHLEQKEQQLSQQYGRQVRIDPSQDPDFQQALSQNLEQLQNQYSQALVQAKEQLREIFQRKL
jgi:hypothetical protein